MAKRKTTETSPETSPQPTAGPEYTVLARRYRPQQFADLVGQEAVAQALTNAIESGRVAHAYLFTGARGVGKTSAARILAKALNCVKGPTATPCDECDICKAITSGEDTDVLEIDGASNRGIDEIREIRQNVNYRPTRSRNKIYIIDEVHMLTTPAFNALLKTLEEPPSHVKFIFATTEVQSIPVTILSRCQRFDFGGISIPRIVDRLKEIVTAEKMQADVEALETIARRAGGSMRDAQSLLDQLLAFSGQKLTVDTVHQLLGTAHEERVTALAAAVLGKDAKQVLEILGDVVNQGQQLGELLDQLIEYWRDLMVVNSAGIAGQSVSVSSARRDVLAQQAKQTNLDTILAGMDILVTAKTRMRHSSHGRALLEVALVRMCQMEELLSVAQIAQLLTKSGTASTTPSNPTPQRLPPLRASGAIDSEKKKLSAEPEAAASVPTIELTADSSQEVMSRLGAKLGFAAQSDFRKVISTAISAPNALVLSVSRRYNSPACLFADPVRLTKATEVLAQITGQSWSIRVDWTDDQVEGENGSGKTQTAVAMSQQRMLRSELQRLPFVKKATEVLGAQIMRADEGFGTVAKSTPADIEDSPTEDE